MIISKEQWKEYQELKEVAEEYKQISIMHYNRPYAKRYLKESKERYKKETGRNLLYPDSEEIYKNYYKQKKEIERLKAREQECIDKYLAESKYRGEIEGKYVVDEYIINELAKWLEDVNIFQMNFIENKEHITPYKAVLDKLQELKGSDSNE